MIEATKEILEQFDKLASERKSEILNTKDSVEIKGTAYYVSNDGCDENDGKTPKTAWKTLEKVSNAKLCAGDAVRFRRGDLFRGVVVAKPGVTYCAYGSGEKPKFYGWDKNLSDPSLWTLYDDEHNIWKLNELILDCGTLVFNDGEKHSRKLIPTYRDNKFVCREDESRVFDMRSEMTDDLDLFCLYDGKFTEKPSKGESFPVPTLNAEGYGELYLRCDAGNPADVFESIEAIPRICVFSVGDNPDVTIDNVCIKYTNFGIAAGNSVGLSVTNCEIGWIGGCIQTYLGTDPNYPQGRRGTVTRYGNGIEAYGSCKDFLVDNCYIYEVYDAGATHQASTFGNKVTMCGVRYSNNLIENCVYAIEYFLEKNGGDTESFMDDLEICNNILRLSGYGWGQQRHNTHTPAHIKGWSYENTARNYRVHHNVFDRCAYRMLHLVAKDDESCPDMYENTYIQKYGMTLGQYGGNKEKEPANISFFDDAEEKIEDVFKEKNPKVYYIK